MRDDSLDELRRFGVAEEEIARLAGERPAAECAVWPENAAALEVFLACATQWRMAPMGGVTGLDYAGVEATLRLLRVPDRRAVFRDLQVMEHAALKALHDAAKH